MTEPARGPRVLVTPEMTTAGAEAIVQAYKAYRRQFRELTRRAARHFAERTWEEAQRDARRRLVVYKEQVDAAVATVRAPLGPAVQRRAVWTAMRDTYTRRILGRDDCELAETFFNSVTRRIFATVGVAPEIEFVLPGDRERRRPMWTTTRWVGAEGGTEALARRILASFDLGAPFADAEGDARRVARAIDEGAYAAWGVVGVDGAELVSSVFYRNKGAYLVGRLRAGEETIPLVIALLHPPEGVVADAVLTTSDETSVVFGFSWSYFQVDTPSPHAVAAFLSSIMPLKRIDELYTAIGFNKHGKTELYRAILEELARPGARFALAEGTPGLVMAVFALAGVNVAFKIIRDQFGQPKQTTRREVMDRYQFVFVRDRVGRLADAQEFEHLEFPARCFEPTLLDELLRTAPSVVELDRERVIVRHLYTERLLTPLNLHVQHAPPAAARDAVVDYGNAIRDLAHADIFPGDMLLKNFGVSRHGRVICYDYDELTTLGECRFRELPRSGDPSDDLAAEPWFSVGEHDVFPEQLLPFMVPAGPLREAFLEHHAELFDPGWWRGVQERLAQGELFDVFPYAQARRLGRGREQTT
jgi:isocitrate dehydrogenase kinase/phosphatase